MSALTLTTSTAPSAGESGAGAGGGSPTSAGRAARVPAWAYALSAVLVFSVRLAPCGRLAGPVAERLFSRLGFWEIIVSPSTPGARAAFISSLVATVRAGLRRGNLQRGPVIRWVARLLASAWRLPQLSAEFSRVHGFSPPAFLVVSATERCNLECSHCYEASSPLRATSIDYATFDELLTRQRSEWGAALVVITGGEPFLYSAGRGDLLTLARDHASTLFIVHTNGTRISDDVARRLAELGNVLPLISLEGDEAHTEAVRGRLAWPAAMEAMRRLRTRGALFGVSITACRANAELLGRASYYQKLRDQQGATFFLVCEHAPLGRGAAAGVALLSLADKARLQASLARCLTHHGLLITSFLHAPTAFSGCLGAQRVDAFFHVDAMGDIKHCVYSPFRLGNVRELFAGGRALSQFLVGPRATAIRAAQRSFFARPGALAETRRHRPCPVLDHSRQILSPI